MAKFDAYKDSYASEVDRSVLFTGKGVDFFTQVKALHLLGMLRSHFGARKDLEILDVGCGVGTTDRFLLDQFKSLHGIDVSEGAIEKAKLANPEAHYLVYDGQALPFSDSSLDVVFAINVLHHIDPARWDATILEFKRVLRPGGICVVFEHNPINPLTRLAVARCEFDDDAVLLSALKLKQLVTGAGLNEITRGYVVFFPFFGSFWMKIERALRWLPAGAQHFVCGVKK